MNAIHAGLVEGFYLGDDAVLLILNNGGTSTFLAALTRAAQQGSAPLDLGDTTDQFSIEPGAAHVEFGARTVGWRFDEAKAAEVIELLSAAGQSTHIAGHHYVDITAPADLLVLSYNEHGPECLT
jgi:hypothetical protein